MRGPRNFQAHRTLRLEKSSSDGYIILLMAYARSPFRDFQSYFRIIVGLDEDDIQVISKQHNSIFFTNEITPGVYSIKDVSEDVYTRGDHEKTLQIEYDDISRKTKLILTHFGLTFKR